jgi:DNA-binding PadR family transcriptional regulator
MAPNVTDSMHAGSSQRNAVQAQSGTRHAGRQCEAASVHTRSLKVVAIFVAALVLWSMSRQRLGDFEQQVLLASLRIQGEVYAVPVAEEIERATGRAVSHAAVYIAMQRLEQRGLVKSRLGPRSDRPGGKQKRLYTVTRRAVNLLAESREAYDRLWAGLDLRRLLEERTR